MIGVPSATYWPTTGTLLATPSSFARTVVRSRSSTAVSRIDFARGKPTAR